MLPASAKRLLLRLTLTAGLALLSSLALAQPPRILVLGDSLSAGYGIAVEEGWVPLLAHRLEEKGYPHQVINASISGETSQGGLKRLPRLLEEHQPTWVILELGGNDGLRGYPVDQLRKQLQTIVERSRDADARVLLMGMQIPPNYGPRYTRQFTDVYTTLAEEMELPFVPFMLEGVATNGDLMQRDGIHPNAEAQALILDNVWEGLAPHLNTTTTP